MTVIVHIDVTAYTCITVQKFGWKSARGSFYCSFISPTSDTEIERLFEQTFVRNEKRSLAMAYFV